MSEHLWIVAIDPGPTQSAFIEWNGVALGEFGKWDNEDVLAFVDHRRCIIEQVASYGMTVGKDVFETVFWSGRFAQVASRFQRLPRLDVKMHLCHDSRAKDSNIRQALIDRFASSKQAAIGLKKTPGPLYGVKADVWQALALAVTWWDKQIEEVAGG